MFGASALAVLAARPAAARALWLHRGALGWMVFAAGMTNACFNTALATGDVVRSVLLFYLMPMWVVGLARLAGRTHYARGAGAYSVGARRRDAGAGRRPAANATSRTRGLTRWPSRPASSLASTTCCCANVRRHRRRSAFRHVHWCRRHRADGDCRHGDHRQAIAALAEPVAWLVIGLFTVAVLIGNLPCGMVPRLPVTCFRC